MRLLWVLFLLFPFFAAPSLSAQAQDSNALANDSARHQVRQSVKNEFERWKDSVEAVRIKKEVEKNGKPLDVFLQEMREREKAEKRQLYFRIGLGALFLTVLALGLARRRKKT